MPRPDLPMTPAASTDISAQEKSHTPTEVSFSLGPPALHGDKDSESSNASVKSDSSYHPNSPAPPPSRKRSRASISQSSAAHQRHQQQQHHQHGSSAGNNQEPATRSASSAANSAFSLPPPPSRSRKIIQMKPGSTDKKSSASTGGSGTNAASASSSTATTDGKSKSTAAVKGGAKSGGASSASKKTARKTAHSVIERRRRSKMNEEFDTMKEMIPACQGQSMHKLAILQAGIDYLRYLEQCVADLKAANNRQSGTAPRAKDSSAAATPRGPRSPLALSPSDNEDGTSPVLNPRSQYRHADPDDDDEDIDVDDQDDHDEAMSDATAPSPTTAAGTNSGGGPVTHAFTFVPSAYSSTAPSPAGAGPTPSTYTFSRSSTLSSLPSPAFGPLGRSGTAGSSAAATDYGRYAAGYHHSIGSVGSSAGGGVSAGGSGSGSGSGILVANEQYAHSVESSPAILPNAARDVEMASEASQALLMLGNDRRGPAAGRFAGGQQAPLGSARKGGGGGLSVQDLLSG